MVVHVEDARGLADALEQHAQPEEVHRLVVQHRAAHEAERELRRRGARAGRPRRGRATYCARGLVAREPQVELVGRLPDVEREHLADRARALARARGPSCAIDDRVLGSQVM